MKRIIALFLAMTLFFSGAGEVLASTGIVNPNLEANARTNTEASAEICAEANTEIQLNGYMSGKAIGIPCDEADADGGQILDDAIKLSEVYNHNWDKYSTNYYYNLLNDNAKALWDELDALCVYYLEKDADMTNYLYDSEYNRYTCLEKVDVNFTLSLDSLKLLWNLFMLSNPQYYFLLNVYGYNYEYDYDTYDYTATAVTLCAYNAFADGDDRAAATKRVKKQITNWQNIVDKQNTEEAKVKAIHDLVCGKVTYNYDVFGGGYGDWLSYEEEQEWFTQSAYSVLCMDTTVCAGYSDAMAIMCNGAGLDAVSVTSPTHQWNKVRINDVWYNYDTTWADSDDSYVNYRWFARADEVYEWDGYDHTEESFWYGVSPEAITDVASTQYAPGTYPKLSKTVATPKIKVSTANGNSTIEITCDTPGAMIWYTIDGKNPGVASAKSEYYAGAFTVKEGATVKAIAICEGYKDSKIASSKGNSDAKSIKKATVKLAKTKYYYDGEVKKPKVTVKLSGKTLKANKDYKLTYKNNKNIGTATVTVTGIGDYAGTVKKTFKIVAATGETFTSGNNKYEVTGSSTVAFTGIKKIKKTVTVPSTVKFGGATFKVTKIADNALKNKTKVEGVTVGANVKEIGKQAFIGCKNLKTITIKSTKITKVGKNALKGINAKAKIKVPAKKLKDYKKLFKNKGQGKKVTIVKSK